MRKPAKWHAPSKDSDQLGHLPRLIRIFTWCSVGSQGPMASSHRQGRLIRLCRCTVWSESSLGAHDFLGIVMPWLKAFHLLCLTIETIDCIVNNCWLASHWMCIDICCLSSLLNTDILCSVCWILVHIQELNPHLLYEPAHEIMALIALLKLNLQTRMRSHPVGLDVWFSLRPFIYCHTLCVRTARLCGCAGSPELSLVAYAISTIIYELAHIILLVISDERDYTHCCKQRGIPDNCLGLCQLRETTALVPSTELIQCVMLKDDLSYCFNEGKGKLCL